MTEVGIVTLVIIMANVLCSAQGWSDRFAFRRNGFDIGKIRLQHDYRRILTAGFFHVNGIHLLLNMITLCLFMGVLGLYLGETKCLSIYFSALIGGNLFAVFAYRRHNDYTAAPGASGAVAGIVFAAIALLPGVELSFFGKQFPISGAFYGTVYILFSLYAIKSRKDNMGHEIQLAGGMIGMITAVVMQPSALQNNYAMILAIFVTVSFVILIIITRPNSLLIYNKFFNQHSGTYIIETIQEPGHIDHEQEIDLILEKIHQNGLGSLSKAEKAKLDHYSRIIQ